MDLFPTLADMANIRTPQNLDGVSQKEVLLGDKESVRDWIFMHYTPLSPLLCALKPARFIFDTRWKLYGDGTFARIDAEQSLETLVDVNLDAEGLARRAGFQVLLDGMGDGPLHWDQSCKEDAGASGGPE